MDTLYKDVRDIVDDYSAQLIHTEKLNNVLNELLGKTHNMIASVEISNNLLTWKYWNVFSTPNNTFIIMIKEVVTTPFLYN